MKNQVQKFCRIYGDNTEAYLTVTYNPDGLDLVEVGAGGEDSEENYGKLHLPLTKSLAKLLGEILIEMSNGMAR